MRKNKKTILITSLTIVIIAVFLFLTFYNGNNKTLQAFSTSIKNLFSGSGAGEVREQYNFNYGWRFTKGEGTINASSTRGTETSYINISDTSTVLPYSSSYDESTVLVDSWKDVSLPHTYNDEDTFNTYQETNNLYGERSLYSGTAWYKKEFTLPNETGKRVIIEFEAARQAAKVYVNGVLQTGTYENGFIAFGYDITDSVNFGATNTIVVMVDNSYPYTMEGTTSIVPWHDSHWHPNYGGLYRNSYLYIVDDLHLSLPLYSFTEGQGTYVYTSDEAANIATIHVDAEIENNSDTSRTFSYKALIKDANGSTVLTLTSPSTVTLTAGSKQIYQMSGNLLNPTRWSSTYPYLYTATVQIIENGTTIDDTIVSFGIRTLKMTNDYGFYLNENYVVLDGWGQKATQEWATFGAAYPNWLQDYTIKLMKDANANFIRWGHVAGSSTQIDITDKYGIMVLQPGVDGEGNSASSSTYTSDSFKLRIEAMRDMIINMRNHPSIIMWEIGNQSTGLVTTVDSTYINSLSWLTYSSSNYTSDTYGSILNTVINQFDYGNRTEDINSGTFESTVSSSDRLIAIRQGTSASSTLINEYVDVGETTQGSGSMLSSTYGAKPAVEGEYDRLEVRRGVWDHSTTGFETFTNSTSSSDAATYSDVTNESFAISQIEWKNSIKSSTKYVGGANWIFSDSISHGRVLSEVSRVSGEVDAMMIPKESYYVDQTIFGEDPSVYIIGHWNYPAGTVKNIYVAGNNVKSVKLYLNGTLVGNSSTTTGLGTLSNGYLYTFTDVTWASGTLTAVGYNASGEQVATNSVTTHGEPYEISITPLVSSDGAKANGSDIILFDVELLDSNGNRCISYDGGVENENITFTYDLLDGTTVTGTWLGGYNSAEPTNTRSDTLYFEAGITRVSVRTSKNAGDISVTATMGTLTDTSTVTTSSMSSYETYSGLSTYYETLPTYTLNASLNSGVGDGAQLGKGTDTTAKYNSLLINNLSYYGTSTANEAILDGIGVGDLLYSNQTYTFTDIPYKYLNSEVISVSDADNTSSASTLLTFYINRSLDVLVLRDPATTSTPSWLSTYTDTGDNVVGSNGITYDVYKKSYVYDSSNNSNNFVIIGGNTSDGSSNGANQIIMVKETSKVTNSIFFHETFDDFTYNMAYYGLNGYRGSIPSGHFLFFGYNSLNEEEDGTIGGKTGIKLHETDTSNLTYLQKSFAPLSREFYLDYSLYVSDTMDNRWIRLWPSYTQINYEDDKEYKIIAENYAHRNNDGTGTTFKVTSRATLSASGTQTIANNFALNTWYKFRYKINPATRKYSMYYYDDTTSSWTTIVENRAFTVTTKEDGSNITEVDNFIFGTGKSYTSDFYIDDIEIKPIMDIGATAITIDGSTFNISENQTDYFLYDLTSPSDSVITITPTNDYASHSVVVNSDGITVTLTNLQGETFTFNVAYTTVDLLDGVAIYYPVGQTQTSVTADYFQNNSVIHFVDTSSTELAYIEKQFGPISTSLEFSYDIYLKNQNSDQTITYTNTYLRSFLDNASMGNNYNADTSTLIGVHSYINKSNSITSFRNVGTTTTEYTTDISLDTWHNVKYKVDIINNTYDTYLDNVLISTTSSDTFANAMTSLSHLVIGTGISGTEEFYIKNINVVETTDVPIDNISIDNVSMLDFDPYSSTYSFYTDNPLTSSTNITLDTNPYYVSHTISLNIETQVATIDIIDNIGGTQTYQIVFLPKYLQEVSKQELYELIQIATNNYTEDYYTPLTWGILQDALTEANTVYDDINAITTQITLAYQTLTSAINGLLTFTPYDDSEDINATEGTGSTYAHASYTEYDTSLVDTIYYSSNLSSTDFQFNKVLENGALVYNDASYTNYLFTSVPYKYMNAEYLILNNTINTNASFQFTALYDLDVLIFKDWNSGPLTSTEADSMLYGSNASNPEPSLVNTKEIITAGGTVNDSDKNEVYYVYKKSFHRGDIININANKIINNTITNNNNIIAFIRTENSNNTNFFYENMNNYSEFTVTLPDSTQTTYTANRLYDKSWTDIVSYILNTENTTSSTATTIEEVSGGDNYLHQVSADSKTIPIVQKRFASLSENVIVEFDAYTEDISSDNLFLRTWLTKFDSPSGIKGNADDTKYTLAELYFQETNFRVTSKNYGSLSVANWYRFRLAFDILKQKISVLYYVNGTPTSIAANKAFKNKNKSALYSTNYIYFAGRGQDLSSARYKNITITPVASDVYTDINVTIDQITNSLGCGTNTETCTTTQGKLYQDLTNAYLYKTPTTSLPSVTTTKGSGTSYTNESINTTQTTFYDYSNISSGIVAVNSTNYSRNQIVYYELEDNGAKIDLVNKVNQALSLNGSYYTTTSWNDLIEELNDAYEVLGNHKASETDIDTETTAVNDKIAALVLLSDAVLSYDGYITAGKQYETFDTTEVNITKDSSVTARFHLLERSSNSTYYHSTNTHTRFINVDSALPEGTKITIYESLTDKHYYYTVTSSDSSKVRFPLSDFKLSGTTDNNYPNGYNFNSTTHILEENFYVTLDFSNTTTNISNATHTIQFELDLDGVLFTESSDMSYTTYSLTTPVTIEVSAAEDTMYAQDPGGGSVSVTVGTITSNGKTITDTTLLDKKVGIRFTLYNANDQLIPFPSGTIFSNNTTNYYADGDGSITMYSANSLQSFEEDYSFNSEYRDFVAGTYYVKAELLVSYDGINYGEKLDDDTGNFTIIPEPKCSLYATVDGNNHIIDLSKTNVLNTSLSTYCKNITGNITLTVKLYKKDNALFSNHTFTPIDFPTYINNEENYTLYDTNEYKIFTRTNVSSPVLSNFYSFSYDLLNTLGAGTYKLEYGIIANGKHQEDFVSFVVK